MNKTTIFGRLVRDPEAKLTKKNNEFFSMVVADDVGKDQTIFWSCTYFGEGSKKVISYLKKGSAVVITGDITKPSIYQRKDGENEVSMRMNVSAVSFPPKGMSSQTPKQQEQKPIQEAPVQEEINF